MILCFYNCIAHTLHTIQTEIHGSEIKRHKHGMRNILLGIQFFICWVFVAFTVALYMQAEKTESTLFNTLTEKEKANILSFSIDYMFMKNEEKPALIERISKFSDCTRQIIGRHQLSERYIRYLGCKWKRKITEETWFESKCHECFH